jgi:6,7-dimethyl-8-ribityllumazine synthase
LKIEQHREAIAANDMRFAIVVSRWNQELTSRLAAGAREALTESGVSGSDIEVFEVPGAFELPVASRKAAGYRRFDAVIALGVVIRGDTPHFDHVAGQAAAGIMQASLETGKPVLFGVITADNDQQAIERCGERFDNKGYEAARSAIETVATLRRMTPGEDEI